MMERSDPWITLGMDEAYCLNAFTGPCKEIYVLEYDNELRGFMILQICGSFKGYIQTLFVKEGDRGKGYGLILLHFADERIRDISPNIFICVSSFNTEAIKLYERFGFAIVGELKDFVKKGFSELLYRKSTGPLIDFKPKHKKLPE
jgi:ribosomal protein S18 acetylase RimI-like enzyme